jgi:hypothetical protein
MKKEAKFQTIFNQYIRIKRIPGVFELKQTESDTLLFSALKEHQKKGLLATTHEGVVWKLSDSDPREKPFDCISTPPLNAYVAIKYPNFFCIIHAYIFINEEGRSKEKSLSSERARQLASYTVYN